MSLRLDNLLVNAVASRATELLLYGASPVLRVTISGLLAACLVAGASFAQDGRAELRARQDALFQQMIDEPANLTLMFEYAQVSMKLEDYESAISTLERMLIYRKDLTRVRLELAVAYFNIGSYATSEIYFNEVLEDPAVDQAVRDRIALYLGQIEQRTAKNDFSLVANLGITYATNATLGPLDDEVTVGGIDGFVLESDSQAEDDFGIRTLIYGSHSYDLGRPNTDAWETSASLFALEWFDVERGDTIFGRLRTGPRLALDDEQFGKKIRPYIEGQYLNSDGRSTFWGAGGGAEFGMPLSADWSVFADGSAMWFDYEDRRDDEDRLSLRLTGGGAWSPSRAMTARIGGILEADFADEDWNSNIEAGVRASGAYQYDSGFDFVNRNWILSGYADARYRWYAEEDPAIDPDETRREVDLRVGLSHLFAIDGGFGVQLDVEGFRRDANIGNFDLDNLSVTLSAQYRM